MVKMEYDKEEIRTSLIDQGQEQRASEKSTSPQRWVILILSCIMLLGSYWCFDTPSALKGQIHDYMGDSEDFETYFALMYTLYAAPNTIIPLFGGFLVDAVGVCPSLLACTVLLTLGQVVVAIGFTSRTWSIILLGRFIFALGGENLIVASSALLADWFIGAELAFSFGINLSIARVGGVANNVMSPYFTQKYNILLAFWVGAFVCGLSVVSVILAWPIDVAFDQKIVANGGKTRQASTGNLNEAYMEYNPLTQKDVAAGVSAQAAENESGSYGSMEDSMGKVNHAGLGPAEEDESWRRFTSSAWWAQWWRENPAQLTGVFWLLTLITLIIYGAVLPFNNVASTLLLERDYFKATPGDCPLEYSGQCQSATNPPVCILPANTAPPLPVNITVGTEYYSVVEPYDVDCTSSLWTDPGVAGVNSGCTEDYCSQLSSAQSKAAVVMSIPYTLSAVLSPFLGFLIDRYGQRATTTMVSAMVIVAVHAALAFTSMSPEVPLVGQGIAYTCFAAVLWPAIPIVVELERQGLAFGIATASYNMGCGILPLIVAAIYTHDGDHYIPDVEYLFIALGIWASALGIYLVYVDYFYLGGVLNAGMPVKEKESDEVGLDLDESTNEVQ